MCSIIDYYSIVVRIYIYIYILDYIGSSGPSIFNLVVVMVVVVAVAEVGAAVAVSST